MSREGTPTGGSAKPPGVHGRRRRDRNVKWKVGLSLPKQSTTTSPAAASPTRCNESSDLCHGHLNCRLRPIDDRRGHSADDKAPPAPPRNPSSSRRNRPTTTATMSAALRTQAVRAARQIRPAQVRNTRSYASDHGHGHHAHGVEESLGVRNLRPTPACGLGPAEGLNWQRIGSDRG